MDPSRAALLAPLVSILRPSATSTQELIREHELAVLWFGNRVRKPVRAYTMVLNVRARHKVLCAMGAATASTPFGSLLRCDGDHAIMTRVLQYLVFQPVPAIMRW